MIVVPNFVDPMSVIHLLCVKCHGVAVSPVLTKCGHRLCSVCLNDIILLNSLKCLFGGGVCDDVSCKRFTCPLEECGEQIGSNEVKEDEAGQMEMKKMIAYCQNAEMGCDETMEWELLEEHQKSCEYRVVKCENPRCLQNILFMEMESHMKDDCLYRSVQCPYCDTILAYHELKYHEDECEGKEKSPYQLYGQTIEEIKVLKAQIILMNSQLERWEKEGEKELAEMKDEKVKMQKILKANNEEFLKHIGELNKKFGLLEYDVALVEQRVIGVETETSYDGKFTWVIQDYQQKRRTAKTGTRDLYSPAFYTKQTGGYKFQMRLFLDGDGAGRGTHIGVFIIVMKGKYDNALTWPLKGRITFTLISQDEKQPSITKSFTIDDKCSSFQQPYTERNIGSGLNKMALISDIEDPQSPFLKHNTIMIECKCDIHEEVPVEEKLEEILEKIPEEIPEPPPQRRGILGWFLRRMRKT